MVEMVVVGPWGFFPRIVEAQVQFQVGQAVVVREDFQALGMVAAVPMAG